MKFKKGIYGETYVIFNNESHADKWEFLFYHILRRERVCFGGYLNAYVLTKVKQGV